VRVSNVKADGTLLRSCLLPFCCSLAVSPLLAYQALFGFALWMAKADADCWRADGAPALRFTVASVCRGVCRVAWRRRLGAAALRASARGGGH